MAKRAKGRYPDLIVGQLEVEDEAQSQKRWGGSVRDEFTSLVLQKSGPAPLLCVMGVHFVKQALEWSLKGCRGVTFLSKLTARNFTHLNKQTHMPNITLVYREMSVVELKHYFKRFPIGGF